MSAHFPHMSWNFARFVSIALLLWLAGCGGSSSRPAIVTPPPTGSPTITSLSPTSGVIGASVTVSGSNFGSSQGSNTVTFNGQTASVSNWTDTAIVAKVPSGATSGDVVVSVDGTASNGVSFNVVTLPTGSIALSNFGFQCGPGDTADCEGSSQGVVVWPTTQAQPGLLRLHDAGTQWANVDKGGGNYDWTELDQWLDLIAAHQPVEVSQVFTWVPCWDAPAPCTAPPTAPAGTSTPPSDLGTGGSPSFNAFVTAFVTRCSAAGNCVGNCPSGMTCATTNLIKYYEMWNEWDLTFHWTGTMAQVYQMVAPAASIIRANVSNAVIMTPSGTPDAQGSASNTGLGYQADFQNWLNYETANGRISDWIDWHVYLTAGPTTITPPEVQWSTYNLNFLSIQASTPAWVNAPWANTETNFNGAPLPGLNYTCPSSSSPNPPTTFSADDCTGMIVRWQLLHDSNGSAGVYWYKWNETIGGNQQYETAYYYMMQYLAGGKFGGPCSSADGVTWTCSFAEASGTQALWVWTPNESGASFTVPSGYVDYLDLTGKSNAVTAGSSIPISTMPIMLEQ